jgi:hypothetical protein
MLSVGRKLKMEIPVESLCGLNDARLEAMERALEGHVP